jgi:hypothetical protein
MSNKFSSSSDLLITINDSSGATLELYTYFLHYLKKRKNLDGIKNVIRYLRRLSNELLIH